MRNEQFQLIQLTVYENITNDKTCNKNNHNYYNIKDCGFNLDKNVYYLVKIHKTNQHNHRHWNDLMIDRILDKLVNFTHHSCHNLQHITTVPIDNWIYYLVMIDQTNTEKILNDFTDNSLDSDSLDYDEYCNPIVQKIARKFKHIRVHHGEVDNDACFTNARQLMTNQHEITSDFDDYDYTENWYEYNQSGFDSDDEIIEEDIYEEGEDYAIEHYKQDVVSYTGDEFDVCEEDNGDDDDNDDDDYYSMILMREIKTNN
ncbi:unnamed protein product [Schistosoma turkestanicum]|nr:unnamed protein product [Schistosoma turkestanicum]